MYAQYFLGVFLALCLANMSKAAVSPMDAARLNALMNPPDKDNSANILTAKDSIGHFPGLANTIYPGMGMLPPGYTYTRRIRTSGNPVMYPQGGNFNSLSRNRNMLPWLLMSDAGEDALPWLMMSG